MTTAIVTGASSGIGKEMALYLATKGYELILVARSEDRLDKLKAAIHARYGLNVIVIPCDLGASGGAAKLIAAIGERWQQVNILVNNAGFGKAGLFTDIDWPVYHQMIELNISALTELSHHFVKLKKDSEQPCYLLNVASTAAFQAGPLMSVYYASKAYVLHFTEGLAEELRQSKLKVSALCPGPTLSGFQDEAEINVDTLSKLGLVPGARPVAIYGIDQMFAGKVVAIQGWVNALIAFSVRLLPRVFIRRLIYLVSKNFKRDSD